MASLKVTQVRSTIGNKRNQPASRVRSLGLKRIHHSVVVPDNAAQPWLHQPRDAPAVGRRSR